MRIFLSAMLLTLTTAASAKSPSEAIDWKACSGKLSVAVLSLLPQKSGTGELSLSLRVRNPHTGMCQVITMNCSRWENLEIIMDSGPELVHKKGICSRNFPAAQKIPAGGTLDLTFSVTFSGKPDRGTPLKLKARLKSMQGDKFTGNNQPAFDIESPAKSLNAP